MSLCDHSFSLLNVTQIKDYGVMQSPGLHCRQNILKAKLKQLMPCRIEAVVKQKPWPSHREWLKYTLSNQRPISKCVFILCKRTLQEWACRCQSITFRTLSDGCYVHCAVPFAAQATQQVCAPPLQLYLHHPPQPDSASSCGHGIAAIP